MYNNIHIKKNYLFIITTVLSTLIVSSSSISNNGYYNVANIVYGQTNSTNTTTDFVNIQDIPLKKVHVGDIDIAYKTFGKGPPFLLIAGSGMKMENWEPSILRNLSTNHTVTIFDNRGVGNTTAGTKPFSVQQFANDTVGLIDALKVQKADVLGYSLGTFIAQQLVVTHPEKVNRLLLVAGTCGGKESIPPSPQDLQFSSEIMNKSINNVPLTRQDVITLMNIGQGPTWMKSHPNLLQGIPEHVNASDNLFGIPLKTFKVYNDIVEAWKSPNWSGVCDKLTNVTSPTLVITGTEDAMPASNSLIIAAKIPGAWLVQIKDAGHALPEQYPDKLNRVLQTFLSTTTNPS